MSTQTPVQDVLDSVNEPRHPFGLPLGSVRAAHRRTPGNPVRETGPPACMAKLIMLRHKVRPGLLVDMRPKLRRRFDA